MDFITKLLKMPSGFHRIQVVVDRLTESALFLPIKEMNKMEMITETSLNEIVKLHGVLFFTISDRNIRFTSQLWKLVQKSLGNLLDISMTYYPQTDGQSERTIQTLDDMLRACMIDFKNDWDTHYC